MTQWHRPLSLGYVKAARQQVDAALEEAKEQGHWYTPVFWTGSHLKPVLIGLVLKSNQQPPKQRGI